MRAFGARGYVSDGALKRTNRVLAQMRKENNLRRRAEIAALSNRDIQIMMADVIIDAVSKRRCVVKMDFDNAGLPAHRLEKNKAAAMRIARQKEPRLDAMLDGGVSA